MRKIYFEGGCQHCGSLVYYMYYEDVTGAQYFYCPVCNWRHTRDVSELNQYVAIDSRMRRKPESMIIKSLLPIPQPRIKESKEVNHIIKLTKKHDNIIIYAPDGYGKTCLWYSLAHKYANTHFKEDYNDGDYFKFIMCKMRMVKFMIGRELPADTNPKYLKRFINCGSEFYGHEKTYQLKLFDEIENFLIQKDMQAVMKSFFRTLEKTSGKNIFFTGYTVKRLLQARRFNDYFSKHKFTVYNLSKWGT